MNQDARKDQDIRQQPGAGGGQVEDPGQSNAGHYTANAAGRGGGIVSSPPEAQVNAPGRPQSGHGSATATVASGTAGAMSNQGGAAGGGDPGRQASNADSNMSGSGGNGTQDEPIWGS